MTKEGFKLFLQKDVMRVGTCSNSWILEQGAESGGHPAEALYKRYWSYLCGWILNE